jgi:hypothetical protein
MGVRYRGACALSSRRSVSMIMGEVATVVARPQSVAYLQPRQARQHPVEYDKIGRRVGEARFRLVAAIDMRGEPRRVEGRTGLSREIGFSRDGEGRQITPM